MDMTATFIVNGKERKVTTDGNRPLLDVLREDLHLTGAKYGCGEGQCRACTVLIDSKPMTSCVLPVLVANNKTITTIEGLADGDTLHRVQQAFLDEGAMQCGYCVPGMILQTVALLEKNPHPTDDEITKAIDGNICRCCGYPKILQAIRRAAGRGAEVSVT